MYGKQHNDVERIIEASSLGTHLSDTESRGMLWQFQPLYQSRYPKYQVKLQEISATMHLLLMTKSVVSEIHM